ncbi:MAG: hypothetical protein ACK4ON_07230 [Bacteroidia bacterium]
MRTGITFTDNKDRAYIGYKANALDVSDFVINWSDNSTASTLGPDNLIFNFTADGNPAFPDMAGTTLAGREVMRMTGYGNVGIGPKFNNTTNPPGGAMGQPQSLLHLSNFSNCRAGCKLVLNPPVARCKMECG